MKGDLLAYLSGLTVTQGRLAGQPFEVLPWQQRFIRSAFAPGVQSAALSVGRGNGKTALLSGIAAATLDGPLAVPRGETVIVASSFEQARIAFEHVIAFMGDKLGDKRRWKVWNTAQQARIEDRKTGARVRCIGSDPRRAHGIQRRRRRRARLSPGLRRWPGDSCHEPVVAQRNGRGAHRERSGGQRETVKGLTRRPSGAGARRCSGGGDLGGCGWRAATGCAQAINAECIGRMNH